MFAQIIEESCNIVHSFKGSEVMYPPMLLDARFFVYHADVLGTPYT